MDKITQEVTAICKNRIDTLEDLETKIAELNHKKENLIKERKTYYGKINRCKSKKDEERKEKLQQDAKTITEEIKAITKEVRLYEGVKERSLTMKEKLNAEKELKRKEHDDNECRWRNSRSSGKNESTRH